MRASRITGNRRGAWIAKLAILLVAVLISVVTAGIGLRLKETLTGGQSSVEDALEASARAELGDAQGRLSLKGLVQPSRNENTIFELKANLNGTFHDRPLRTNRFGMRDRDYDVDKPAGAFRIVALGDSVLFGWGVEQNECYTEVLERRLDERSRFPIEVLNFGTPGYNTAQQVALLLEKAARFSPDLVLLHFVGNDLDLPHFLQSPRSPFRLEHWRLVELAARALGAGSTSPRELLPHSLSHLPSDHRSRVRERYRHLAGEEGFRTALERLRVFSNELDVPILIVAQRDSGRAFELAAAEARRLGFPFVTVEERFLQALRNRGLEPPRRAFAKTLWISPQDHHPNALGHSLYADAIVAALDELELLPASGRG